MFGKRKRSNEPVSCEIPDLKEYEKGLNTILKEIEKEPLEELTLCELIEMRSNYLRRLETPYGNLSYLHRTGEKIYKMITQALKAKERNILADAIALEIITFKEGKDLVLADDFLLLECVVNRKEGI